MSDLRGRMARGAAWMVLFRLLDRSIGLVSTLILARLLVPADFGVVAMAMSIVAALEVMTAFSFDLALIQRANTERRHYDAAWTLNLLFAAINSAILVVVADFVAAFFREPRLPPVMYCLALYVAVQGFTNIGVVAFQKDLQLHRDFLLGIARRLFGFAITVALAFALRNYWALVGGMLATATSGVLLSYWMHPFRPRFGLKGGSDLLHFSKWLLANNFLLFLMHKGPDIAIGRLAGPDALGTYNLAYEISNLPTTELVFPIGRAVFPGFSKLAGDLDELRRSYLDVLSVILLIVVPAGFGTAALADPLVNVLLGSKWIGAIELIQLLCVFGVLRAAVSNAGSVYMALGTPSTLTKLLILHVSLLIGALWVLVPSGGAVGAAQAVVLAASVQVPINFMVLSKMLGFGIRGVLDVALRPLISGAFMYLAISMLRSQVHEVAVLLQLVLLIPAGMILYAALLLVLWGAVGRPHGGELLLLEQGRRAVRASVASIRMGRRAM